MDKRKKPVDQAVLRAQRVALFDAIERGDISLRDAARQMRALSRLTQPEFAAHRGVSVKVIKELERGTGNPTLNSLNQIGSIFGLEVGWVRTEKLK
jgi:DNA-binding XRE family transcriptional regulator